VSQNGRKFIIESSYITNTKTFSKRFLNWTQRNPNVVNQLTTEMKKALKASHKKDVVNQQVVGIEKQVNRRKNGFNRNITTWKGFVVGGNTVEVDKQWITTQFKTRVPEFYDKLMEAKGKSDIFRVPAGASKRTNDMDTGKDNIKEDLKKRCQNQ
jgi:hypothetical protein